MLGLEGDDEATVQRTIDFIIGNHMYDAQIAVLTPLPGTRLRERLKRQGRILPTTWDNYTVCNANFVHDRLSKEQLEMGVLQVYQAINTEEVYLRKLEHFKAIHRRLAQANGA